MKKFLLGVLFTILIEGMVFVYLTCNVQVKTTYLYNPDAIVEMLGNYSSITK